jgi:signal transduction histidine kinase/AraC-like DNA-binding protein/streptogramin lyase
MTKENGRIPDNVVMTAFRDSKDNVWFGTYDGWVYKLNAHTGSMQKERLPMGAGSFSVIFRFYEDSKGRMFVGTNYGFFILDAATMAVKARYDERNSPLPEPYIRSICQDWHGRYWVGTFGSGLTILTSDMKLVKQFWVSKGASSNTINQIVAGKNDKIWVATGDGVMCFDASNLNRSKCYNETNGLLNCKVHSLAQDAQGNVWVGTNRGLSCIVPTKGKVYNYANIDNIGNGEFNDGSVTADSQGKLYFGYNGGIFGFNPSNIKEHYRLPPIGFTNLEVRQGFQGKANRILYLANQKTVDLDYDENTFTVGFNVRDNALNGSVYYAYRVKELSDSWYEIGHDQQVTFRNLPHGTYTMEVKARINDKDWSGPETSVAICIAPPFWLSWWAKTIYILLALGVVVLIFYAYRNYLLRLNQLQMEKSSRKKETEMNNERLRFYTNIAHELRTPLTLVIGPLDDLLRGGTLTDIVRHQVEMISKNANRLLGLVNQIMEFRKTETQNRKLKVARQNLSEVVTEELLKFKEANKNPNLVFDLDLSDKNITLYFDKEVISIILDNLLSNSVKYTPSGSIMITVNARPSAVPPVVDISVIDTGYGIAPEAIPHLFERYYQAGGEHQVSGTGIGLALVRSLSDLHQGTLNVRSKVGEGTAITFSLQMENTYPDAEHAVAAAESPKLPTCDDEPSVQKETVSGSEEPDEGHLLILVVEDNPDIAAYIKDSFEDTYDVVTAENGKEGEEQAFKLTPDIIVSDIMMPVMDGIEMCQTLKNDIRTSHIPIILLTAKDSMLNKEEGYLAGADSYITKPFSSSLLLSRINNLLENRRRQAKQVTTAQLNDKKEQLNVFANQHDNEFIKRVTDIIKQNISEEKLDIGFVAEHMNMSISSLYRKMKALTGQSTNEFIRKIRMGTAEELLLRHDLSISDVAYKVGFSSLSYFRQCFKEVYGSSPSDYIKKITDQ